MLLCLITVKCMLHTYSTSATVGAVVQIVIDVVLHGCFGALVACFDEAFPMHVLPHFFVTYILDCRL
jgi:hypothetical protein